MLCPQSSRRDKHRHLDMLFAEKGYRADLSVSARRQSSHLEPFCTASPRPAPSGASPREAVGLAESCSCSAGGTLAGKSHWVDPLSSCCHLGHFGSCQAKSGRWSFSPRRLLQPTSTKCRKRRFSSALIWHKFLLFHSFYFIFKKAKLCKKTNK